MADSRIEELLEALLNDETVDFQPHSRAEAYLKACCEKCGCTGLPEPLSRNDALLYALAEKIAQGGGGEVTDEAITIAENGITNTPSGKRYNPITVNVPQGITPTGTLDITENGLVDVAQYASANVNVSGGGLPSSISKIDGGSFTFAVDTIVAAKITHNLGVIPLGVIVWCDDDPYPNLYFGGFINNPVNHNIYRIIGYRSGGNMNSNSSFQGTAPIENMLTDEHWSIDHGSYKFKAGITYKWLAWA